MTEYRFGDICKVINGRAYRQPELLDAGKYPVLRVGNFFSSDRWFYSDLELPEDKYCDNGDLLFAWSASFGPRIWDGGKVIYHYHIWKLEPNEAIVDKYYLYYWLRKSVDILTAGTHGSVMAHMTKGDMENQRIFLPCIEEQRKVGKTLRLLDDKIKINSKINDNLQQQAQALFSAWLATHVPVADEVTLGGICLKVTDGSHFSPKDEPSAKIPMLSVKDMEEFDFNLTSCKHISTEDYQKMVANDCVPQVDDILVAKDGSYLKEIFICNEQRELAILSSIAIFRPDTSKIYPEILLAFLKSPRVLQEVRDNYVSGSALPRIVLKDFKKLQFLLPNLAAQGEIAPLLASIRSQIAVNVAENQRLNQLRDALLPKLMSGEIDVSSIRI